MAARAEADRRVAVRFVVTIGILSFFADFTYEGSRSIVGPYLGILHASGATVSVVAGLGEFLGYALRLASGRLADATSRYWAVTILGYVIQMASVPALALTDNWLEAAALIVLERVGKAIRNPPRDAMLSHAGGSMGGYGWAFGLHEALDQFGAMFGPLAVALVLAERFSFQTAFAVLLVPAAINLSLVLLARILYPTPQDMEVASGVETGSQLPPIFWIYLAGAVLVAAGFADYPLIAFHFSRSGTVPGQYIAIFYSVAMAVSGAGSLALGRLFDRFGFTVLIALTLVSASFAPLVFFGNFWVALIGSAVWGLAMGAHESLIPAAVSPMIEPRRRASVFGLFTACYGIAWFAGSALIGILYDLSLLAVVAFCSLTQLAAIPLFVWVGHRAQSNVRLDRSN